MACQGSFLHLLSAPCSVSSSSAKESEKGQMRGYGAAVKACKAIRIKSEARPNGKTVLAIPTRSLLAGSSRDSYTTNTWTAWNSGNVGSENNSSKLKVEKRFYPWLSLRTVCEMLCLWASRSLQGASHRLWWTRASVSQRNLCSWSNVETDTVLWYPQCPRDQGNLTCKWRVSVIITVIVKGT